MNATEEILEALHRRDAVVLNLYIGRAATCEFCEKVISRHARLSMVQSRANKSDVEFFHMGWCFEAAMRG